MSSSLACSVLDCSEESERVFILGSTSLDLPAPVFIGGGVLYMQTLQHPMDGHC